MMVVLVDQVVAAETKVVMVMLALQLEHLVTLALETQMYFLHQ
jgi:hypothetical protein